MMSTSTRPAFMSATSSAIDAVPSAGDASSRGPYVTVVPDVSERLVHRAREGVHRRGLMIAGDDHRAALVRLQVGRHCRNPAADGIGRLAATRAAGAERGRKRAGERHECRAP